MECATGAYRGKVPGLSDSDSSNSDSDGECWKRSKAKDTASSESHDSEGNAPNRPSQPIAGPDFANGSRKRKINNIWSSVLQEQTITSVLGQCGLKKLPVTMQNRACESYDFSQKALDPRLKEDDDDEDTMETDQKRVKQMRELSTEEAKKKRIFLKPPDVKVAMKIIHKLGEKKHHLIFRIVYFIGVAKAMELLAKTEEIEDEGGMTVMNNSRRRTPGGVYIQLLKSDKEIPKNRIDNIFALEDFSPETQKKISKEKKKHKRRLRARQKEQIEGEKMAVTTDSIIPETVENEKPPPTEVIATGSGNDDNLEIEDGEVLD